MRLLVVEDNPNNQQVALELLEGEGAQVQIANHGQEGVEAVAAAEPPFDAVLMDLQMPVMDGFTATRQIREDLGLLDLPIIAMTANAMASDRHACLAAGMNDHVGKPFDLDHLVSVLRRHAGRQQAAEGRDTARVAALPPSVSAAADAAGVDIAAALSRLGGQRAVYQRMLRGFLRELAALPDQLRSQMALADGGHAARLLHTLKGLAATLGAKSLSATAASAEQTLAIGAPVNSLETRAEVLASVLAVIESSAPGLASLLSALQALDEPPAPADSVAPANVAIAPQPVAAGGADYAASLRQLAAQLADTDMAATDTMAALMRQYGATQGAVLAPLDEALLGLDFELGLRLCLGLLATNETEPTNEPPQ
jgi:CheY-like chemotaxis protein/HPt (histidine-containing phosphotransfer) domain-containing protein